MNKTLTALVTLALAGGAQGQWTEGGSDAGDEYVNGSAQVTVGVGPLTSIEGTIDNASFGGQDLDAYVIKVSDANAFFASTDPNDGGFFNDDTPGLQDDSRLWLFDMSGNLVMANDDSDHSTNTDSLESRIGNAGVQYDGPIGASAPGSVVTGGTYVLVIGQFDSDFVDAGGNDLVDFVSNFGALHGTNPAFSGPIAGLNGFSSFDPFNPYRIVLQGAEFAIPAPASAALLGLGGLAAARRRR
ncbi:MAG: hypothetical protein ACTS22_10115 [Phycisphaerales bacterium]